MKDKQVLWSVRVPLLSSHKAEIVELCRLYSTTAPNLLRALLEKIRSENLYSYLIDSSSLPVRYLRNPHTDPAVPVRRLAESRSSEVLPDRKPDESLLDYLKRRRTARLAVVESGSSSGIGDTAKASEGVARDGHKGEPPLVSWAVPRAASAAPKKVDAKSRAAVAWKAQGMPESLGVGKIVPLPVKTDSPAVEELKTTAARRKEFLDVVEKWKLPGNYLDQECEDLLHSWTAKWGQPGSRELALLRRARQVRLEAYAQWRKCRAELLADIEKATRAAQRATSARARRHHQRESTRSKSALRAFDIRTRWDSRNS